MTEETKDCFRCGQKKSLAEFQVLEIKGREIKVKTCKVCIIESSKQGHAFRSKDTLWGRFLIKNGLRPTPANLRRKIEELQAQGFEIGEIAILMNVATKTLRQLRLELGMAIGEPHLEKVEAPVNPDYAPKDRLKCPFFNSCNNWLKNNEVVCKKCKMGPAFWTKTTLQRPAPNGRRILK